MASLELRLPSELIGYAYASLTIPVPDDITPEQVARMHWEYYIRFLQEQSKIADEPVSEPVEAAVAEAAEQVLTSKISATKVDEEKTEISDILDNPPAAPKKPWQNKTAPSGGSLFG